MNIKQPFFILISGIFLFLQVPYLSHAIQADGSCHPIHVTQLQWPSGPVSLAQITRPIPKKTVGFRALRLERIRVTGNKKISEAAILRHIRLSPGDTLNAQLLEQERLHLAATDYFKEVVFSSRPGSEHGAVIVEVEVVERQYPVFETGFGYHDLHGWFLTLIGLRFDHIFGAESRMRVGARLGFHLAGLDAEWEKPAPTGGGFGAGVRLHIYGQEHLFFGSGPDTLQSSGNGSGEDDWNGRDWREFRQQIDRFGGEITLRYRAGNATRFSFGLKAESVEPDSSFIDRDNDQTHPFDELPGVFKPDADQTLITGFVFRMFRDTRDYLLYPTSGSFARLIMEVNSSFLGGDEIFTKALADYRKHIQAGRGWIISTRLNVGIVSSKAPYYERFYIGGIYSIRGFRELSLSPTNGNDGYWLASGELRWPLVPSHEAAPRLTGLIFLDAGQGWQKGEVFSTKSVQSATGYGLRLRLPWIGTLGVDFGIPFSSGKTGENFRIHGSLGFSF